MKMQMTWALAALMILVGCGGGESSPAGQDAAVADAGKKTSSSRSAPNFEGVYRQRMVEVGYGSVDRLLGESAYGEPSAVAEALAGLSMDAVRSAGDVQTLVMYQKGPWTRAQPDVEGEPTNYQIVNSAVGSMWMVSPPERSYLEFTKEMADQMAAQAKQMMEDMGIDEGEAQEYEEAMKAESAALKAVAMGRTADVNGFQASAHWKAEDGAVTVGWCAEDETGFLESMKALMESAAWQSEDDPSNPVCPDHLLEVRTVTFRQGSGGLDVDELLSISRESVSDDLFKVPDGYTRQSYPGMPGN